MPIIQKNLKKFQYLSIKTIFFLLNESVKLKENFIPVSPLHWPKTGLCRLSGHKIFPPIVKIPPKNLLSIANFIHFCKLRGDHFCSVGQIRCEKKKKKEKSGGASTRDFNHHSQTLHR